LIIVLLTGGASALLESPAESIELEDMQLMSELLLASGATINEINCIRKHCSQVKGGGLARKAPLNTMITIILSDVVGSPLDIIASGPTVPDSSTWHDAYSTIKKYKLEQKLPATIVRRIDAGIQQHIADTPKIGDKIFDQKKSFVIGDNYLAAKRACQVAQAMGFNSLLLTTYLQGEAKEAAKFIVSIGLEIKSSNTPIAPPACVILGGETTVTLTETNGVGGRNQELALSAAIELDGIPNITLASFATDGSDGPTTGAGGIVDGTTADRGREKGLQIDDYLQRHDAYHFLQAVGDLIETGPTLTNVNDLILLIVE
jgi:hydroxypyruvate reductase